MPIIQGSLSTLVSMCATSKRRSARSDLVASVVSNDSDMDSRCASASAAASSREAPARSRRSTNLYASKGTVAMRTLWFSQRYATYDKLKPNGKLV